MRECWINVYVKNRQAHLGPVWDKRKNAIWPDYGASYRLHARLKVPALPATDALAAVKAGEGSHIQQEQTRG